MNLKKITSALWAFFLSFSFSAAATMCIVTGFNMGVDTGLLLRVCLFSAAFCSLCYTLPLRFVPLGAGIALLANLWQKGILELSAEAFLNRLSRQYDRAYGWGIIRWGYRVAEEMEPDIVYMLCILGAVIALLTARCICGRKTAILPLAASFLTVAVCFVVIDTVPATPWLYLLLLCALVLMMTGSVRHQDEKQGNRLCLLLTPAVALFLLILFVAIPREGYTGQQKAKEFSDKVLHSDAVQLFLGQVDKGSAVTATDTAGVDLTTVGYRIETQAQALQVTAPFTGTLYLRGRALDTYDGLRWSDSGSAYSTMNWPNHPLEDLGEVTVTTRFSHRMLYMPYYTDISQMREVAVGLENTEQLTEYSFPYRALTDPAYFTKLYPMESVAQNHLDQALINQFIPMDGEIEEWAKSLAANVTGTIQSPYHKANAIASYVRNSARYSLRTPRMPANQKNFAQWFLEESDTGYCIHFATAATVLLQASGIPARYVTGYMTPVTAGEQVTVYSDQAHAWAEYWLPGFGWTILEATPPDSFTEPEETTEATAVTTPTPSVQTPENTPTAPTEPAAPQPKANRAWLLWTVLGVFAAAALVVIIEGQRRLRQHLHQQTLLCAAPNEKALLYWQETVLLAKLLQEEPDKALFSLAQKAKFSPYTLTATELALFESYLQTAGEKLRTHNLFKRLYYRFILAVY